MSSEATYVRLTKRSELPGSVWNEHREAFTGSASEGSLGYHIAAGYVMDGWFLEEPCVGRSMVLLRFRRNGIERLGVFRSSLVMFVGETEIRTANSVYQLELRSFEEPPQGGD